MIMHGPLEQTAHCRREVAFVVSETQKESSSWRLMFEILAVLTNAFKNVESTNIEPRARNVEAKRMGRRLDGSHVASAFDMRLWLSQPAARDSHANH